MEPVFLSPLMEHLIGFRKVSILNMLQHTLLTYYKIEEINLEENVVKVMGPYDPAEHLAQLK